MVAHRTLVHELLTHEIGGMRARRFGLIFILQDGLEGIATVAMVLSFVLRTGVPDVSVHRRNGIRILSRILSSVGNRWMCQVWSSLVAITHFPAHLWQHQASPPQRAAENLDRPRDPISLPQNIASLISCRVVFVDVVQDRQLDLMRNFDGGMAAIQCSRSSREERRKEATLSAR